jgi:hypothetical protein
LPIVFKPSLIFFFIKPILRLCVGENATVPPKLAEPRTC